MINNKIYELAKQADLITFERIHDSMAVAPNIECVAKARKFAELIIKECTNVADEETMDDTVGYAILGHFGVEE